MNDLIVFVGGKASPLELGVAENLANDLQIVTARDVTIEVESDSHSEGILIGCPETSEIINKYHAQGRLGLKNLSGSSEGGSIDVVEDLQGDKLLIIAGIDPMGTQYTVYDFCTQELGVDPCSFWTGYSPQILKNFILSSVESRVLHCPVIPIRCYFDNDNDELANMTKPYLEIDFSYWKEIIDTLLRLKYNAVDLHDHLGRTEYVTREPYLKLKPDYEVNTELLNRIIDYAHSRGMKIQVSFFLGWSFKSISDEVSHNWRDHKEEWLSTWQYYLKETPIGRSDIFLNRPRDQRLDHPFRSSNEETAVNVFNEAFPLMKDIIREHNPQAVVIVDLYSEGRAAYRDGFRPQPVEDYILCWPDSGFGLFAGPLEDLRPYRAGIYMHAGFWRNHLVVDPYVELLEKSMKQAMYQYDMREYCLVNGQTFRHFLLNIEACSKIAWFGNSFNSEEFHKEWINRYFGNEQVGFIKTLLELLHQGQVSENGYVQILSRITNWQSIDLSVRECTGEWVSLLKACEIRLIILQQGLDLIDIIQDKVDDRAHYFHDHFVIPFMLLKQINLIFYQMLQVPAAENKEAALARVNELINEHTAYRNKGDKNSLWKGWYAPETARPNGGYPDIEAL